MLRRRLHWLKAEWHMYKAGSTDKPVAILRWAAVFVPAWSLDSLCCWWAGGARRAVFCKLVAVRQRMNKVAGLAFDILQMSSTDS
jgi:hypothetical protein